MLSRCPRCYSATRNTKRRSQSSTVLVPDSSAYAISNRRTRVLRILFSRDLFLIFFDIICRRRLWQVPLKQPRENFRRPFLASLILNL